MGCFVSWLLWVGCLILVWLWCFGALCLVGFECWYRGLLVFGWFSLVWVGRCLGVVDVGFVCCCVVSLSVVFCCFGGFNACDLPCVIFCLLICGFVITLY